MVHSTQYTMDGEVPILAQLLKCP